MGSLLPRPPVASGRASWGFTAAPQAWAQERAGARRARGEVQASGWGGAFASGCRRTAEPPLHRRHLGGGRARGNAVHSVAAAPRSLPTSGERRIGHSGAPPKKDVEERPEEHRTKETDGAPSGPGPRQQPSALCARGSKKAARSPQRSTSKIKENKHPFALYGWGERQMDMGSQKTHNVCASASVHEIHESALRAKNRRQVEKRKLAAQRQRAHSVDVEKNQRVKPSSAENPWLTEYMRCYSARA
uniref:Centriole, cilia and spindle-associated protein n=1 Tax=Rattus norvegicus TaxID=10116 RepID=A0ABK0LRN8_RAT